MVCRHQSFEGIPHVFARVCRTDPHPWGTDILAILWPSEEQQFCRTAAGRAEAGGGWAAVDGMCAAPSDGEAVLMAQPCW